LRYDLRHHGTHPANSSVLDSTFDALKSVLSPYARLFTVREGIVKNKRDYHLILEKSLVIDGRKKNELWFASLIRQKDGVGFYLTPLCGCSGVKEKLSPTLLRHLDGKTCFPRRVATSQLKNDVQAALEIGLAAYRKRGWISTR